MIVNNLDTGEVPSSVEFSVGEETRGDFVSGQRDGEPPSSSNADENLESTESNTESNPASLIEYTNALTSATTTMATEPSSDKNDV